MGSSAAYALIMQAIVSDLVLIDPNQALAGAQAEDLEDATLFASPVRTWPGAYSELEGARLVALCCGAKQRPGETRLQLLDRNTAIFKQVIPQVLTQAPEAILLVVSNPVDLLTSLVCRLSGLPEGRVFGTGTLLDTARFRAHLGNAVNISPQSVHGYVLGEHGDSEVLVWSTVAVGGIPLDQFARQVGHPLTADFQARIDDLVRNAGARIIQGKGSTCYGIGAAIAHIVRAVRDDECALLTVSAPSPEMGGAAPPCLSLPRIVGWNGIERTLFPSLSAEEREALDSSSRVLLEALAGESK